MRAFRWRNVPVPEPHLIGLGVGILLGLMVPWRVFPGRWVGQALGWPLIVAGVALAAWAVREATETDLERPDRLVTGGPYRFSRNPMYVAWSILSVGIALVIDMAWPLALLPFVLLAIHVVVISEERTLEGRFGETYASYARRVRRYL